MPLAWGCIIPEFHMTFETLGLAPALLRALADNGYTTPTPIQQQAIPLVLSGRDVLGGAQTGTGKTAAFALPVLNRLSKETPPAGPRNAASSRRSSPHRSPAWSRWRTRWPAAWRRPGPGPGRRRW